MKNKTATVSTTTKNWALVPEGLKAKADWLTDWLTDWPTVSCKATLTGLINLLAKVENCVLCFLCAFFFFLIWVRALEANYGSSSFISDPGLSELSLIRFWGNLIQSIVEICGTPAYSIRCTTSLRTWIVEIQFQNTRTKEGMSNRRISSPF